MKTNIEETSFKIIYIGLLLVLFFLFMFAMRTNFYDGKYICGIEENELCTKETTNYFLYFSLISLFSLIIIMLGIILYLRRKEKWKTK